MARSMLSREQPALEPNAENAKKFLDWLKEQ
jgi:hypothetical protein